MADNKYIYLDGERWVVRCKDFDVAAKIFSFVKFGNKALALNAAIAFRNEQIAKHHTIQLLEPEKPPQPKVKPVEEKEPTDAEVAAKWSKFKNSPVESGPEYVKSLTPEVQASLKHTQEALQMYENECLAYHYTGAWDAAFSKSSQGHSTYRAPDWNSSKEALLIKYVKENLIPLRERLPFTRPAIDAWFARQNLIE